MRRALGLVTISLLLFSTASDETPRRARTIAELPEVANGAVRLEDEKATVSLRFALAGAHATRGRRDADGVHFARALGDADLDLFQRDDGVEDTVRYATRPEREATRYDVDVSNVAGLRLVANVLEFLDAVGAPRLRINPPVVVDALGVERTASLSVRGCAADTAARGPWGRPVTAPGASRCEVEVSWAGMGVVYPAAVDPAWTTSASLAHPHSHHQTVVLPSKRILVISGIQPRDNGATEIFDPATGTWAVTASTSSQRGEARAFVLPSGDVLVAGGFADYYTTAPLATTDIYNEARGTWVPGGQMAHARGGMAAAMLPSGKAIVAGGPGLADAEIYDPASDAWSPAGTMSVDRLRAVGRLLPDGSFLVAGGRTTNGGTATAEIFTPPSTWTLTRPMSTPRARHAATTLHDGRIFVVAGSTDGSYGLDKLLASAEIYDPVAKTWSLAGDVGDPRVDTAAVVLKDGRVLVPGGDGPGSLDTTAIYDPNTGRWAPAGYLNIARWAHTATLLDDGKVLVVGTDGLQTELYEPIAAAAPCVADGECTTGFCVDGVCCDARCGDPCMACTAAKKGSGADGTCGPVPAGAPEPDCPTLPASTCGATGKCDGAGACALYASGTSCGAAVCDHDVLTAAACSGRGICNQTITACAPHACASATACAAGTCRGDADCAEGYWCNAQGACVTPGCDGNHVVVAADRVRQDCSPYRCDANACKARCRSTTDCAEDAVCNSEHECIPVDRARRDDGSAGWLCASSPGSKRTDAPLLLLLSGLGALFARRRGRSVRR